MNIYIEQTPVIRDNMLDRFNREYDRLLISKLIDTRYFYNQYNNPEQTETQYIVDMSFMVNLDSKYQNNISLFLKDMVSELLNFVTMSGHSEDSENNDLIIYIFNISDFDIMDKYRTNMYTNQTLPYGMKLEYRFRIDSDCQKHVYGVIYPIFITSDYINGFGTIEENDENENPDELLFDKDFLNKSLYNIIINQIGVDESHKHCKDCPFTSVWFVHYEDIALEELIPSNMRYNELMDILNKEKEYIKDNPQEFENDGMFTNPDNDTQNHNYDLEYTNIVTRGCRPPESMNITDEYAVEDHYFDGTDGYEIYTWAHREDLIKFLQDTNPNKTIDSIRFRRHGYCTQTDWTKFIMGDTK